MAAGRDLVDRVLGFIVKTRWDDLPADVRHQAKRCLLDLLGAMIAGTQTPVGLLTADFAARFLQGTEATIMIDGRRVSPVGAALANGFAGNALDIDDGHRRIKGHPGACVLPALLAAAETEGGVSGQEFLTALVIGYEVGIRAGLIRHAVYPTYHSSGSWGALAGAAAAGRIMGLEPDVLRHALGAAEYHAPIAPMMKGIDTPSMGKDSIGWGAMAAMASVLMARQGFTGITPLFADAPDRTWIENLGRRWEVMNLYFKPYAACRWAQPAIAGALQVVEDGGLEAAGIARITVRTFAAAARLSTAHPRTTEEAQYNLPFPLAAALLDGEVGPGQVLPPRLHDPALLALADRVEVEVDESFERAFPEKTLAEVIVETDDGRVLSSGPVEAVWEPPKTLPSDAELETKFIWLAGPVLGRKAAEALPATIWNLDDSAAVSELITGCLGTQADRRPNPRRPGAGRLEERPD